MGKWINRPPLYPLWDAMVRRCHDSAYPAWKDYGARGIAVCDRWRIFENFETDVGLRPSARHTLDRIDNDGGYEPGNCRWATRREQQLNRRDTRLVTIEGKQYVAAELAHQHGVSLSAVVWRARHGMLMSDVIATGGRPRRASQLAARTHCRHGHEFTTANTHIKTDGSRQCRECGKLQQRRRAALSRSSCLAMAPMSVGG